MVRSRSAANSASSSTIGPRATLISTALGRMRASLGLADQAAGRLVERAGDDDEVGGLEQAVELARAAQPVRRRLQRARPGGDRHDPQAEGPGPECDRAADVAIADAADGLARELGPERRRKPRAVGPAAGPEALVATGETDGEVQHRRKDVLADPDLVLEDVADPAALRNRPEVDRIEARDRQLDQLQLRRRWRTAIELHRDQDVGRGEGVRRRCAVRELEELDRGAEVPAQMIGSLSREGAAQNDLHGLNPSGSERMCRRFALPSTALSAGS